MKSVCNEDYLPKGGGAVTAVNAGLEGGVKIMQMTLAFIILCWCQLDNFTFMNNHFTIMSTQEVSEGRIC